MKKSMLRHMILNAGCNLVWNHIHDFKIERRSSGSSIWNHQYDFRPKLHDTKFNYHFISSILPAICIGNSMICSGIYHKYHEWYFEIVMYIISWAVKWVKFETIWNITSGIHAKYHVQFMLLFVYTTLRKSLVIFTCRYFKLSRNTTALSQSNCRHFSCSSIRFVTLNKIWKQFGCAVLMFLFHWLGKRRDLEQKMVWFV